VATSQHPLFRGGRRDLRKKLFQILREPVLIEDFLVFIIHIDNSTYFLLILLKEVADLLFLSHRLQTSAMSECCGLTGVKAEELTRLIVSRIPFAVWNTVAVSPIAPVTNPNVSAAIGCARVGS
jgi:hypothetical protein